MPRWSQGEAREGEAVSEANVGRGKSVPPQGELAFVWDMRGDPGDELQIIHPLHLFRNGKSAGLEG